MNDKCEFGRDLTGDELARVRGAGWFNGQWYDPVESTGQTVTGNGMTFNVMEDPLRFAGTGAAGVVGASVALAGAALGLVGW